jgi:hypothetical protein
MDARRRNALLLVALSGLLLVALFVRWIRNQPPAPPLPPAQAPASITAAPRASRDTAAAGQPVAQDSPGQPAAATTAPPALPPPRPPLERTARPATEAEPEKVVTAAAGFRSVVPSGGALVTGGWELPDGRRYLFIAAPSAADGGMVMVRSRAVAVPEALLAAPGWARILSAPADRLRLGGGIFDAAERADFDCQLAEAEGVDMLSAPSVTTRLGQLATIEISGPANGLTVSLIANATDDPQSVELAVSTAEFTRPHPATSGESAR